MELPSVDFSRIRAVGPGGQRDGFEQFICLLAAQEPPHAGATFHSLHGAGGDGGVECFWRLPDDSEQAWQSKYWTDHSDVDKAQIDSSVSTALKLHPGLTHYTIAIPADPTGPTAGRGKSLYEKVYDDSGWLSGWQSMAADLSMSVEFTVEWKSNLLARIERVDTTGIQRRYWFDADVLAGQWWQDRYSEAASAARPRYVPELTVGVSAATAISALSLDPEWQAAVADVEADLAEAMKRVLRSSGKGLSADLSVAHGQGQRVLECLRDWRTSGNLRHRTELIDAVGAARDSVADQESDECRAMDAAHGDSWDSPGWRQYMAEYQVSFPAEPVDALRVLLEALSRVVDFTLGPRGQLAGARVALMTGAAGMGKTFLALDAVHSRLERGRPSLVLHGRWFNDSDPLLQLRDRLQLPADLTGEETLALLDHAGMAAGSPVLLIIDALNDTRPRTTWRDHLDRLCAAAGKFSHLRLLLTARTHYVGQVLPSGLVLPRFEHMGFEGVEFEAVTEYANFYGLEPPTSPPIHGEFDNPLYLRLVCEALQRGGRLALDQAAIGLDELARLVLDNANSTVSDRLDAPPSDRVVPRAMTALASGMASSDAPWLSRAEAQERLRPIWPEAAAEKSLLDALIGHGLVEEDVVPDGTVYGADVVMISFERLGHHLLITDALRSMSDISQVVAAIKEGPLRSLLGLDGGLDLGLLEALSVVVADRFHQELTALDEQIDGEVLLPAVVAGLGWRNDASITDETRDIVEAALRRSATFHDALSMLFRVSVRPDHPLNADYLHGLLLTVDMAHRDAFLIPWLHDGYGLGGAVDRLVRWGRVMPIDGVGETTTRLWVTALLWCTGATDRRVRDASSLAAVRLLARRPELAGPLLEQFLGVDDDWIVERAIEVSYAALLAGGSADDWSRSAAVVWTAVFAADVPTSAVIRDAARSLIEAAAQRAQLPATVASARIVPPHASSWPIGWPDEATVEPYDSRQYPKLVFSCTGDDFFTYQVSWALRDRSGINLAAAGRRLVLDVLGLGYSPDLHAAFDRKILSEFGGGRGKPAWIERIGKKYQWIALARLVGVVNDHVPRSRDQWDPPPPAVPGPQADRLRQLDPTVFQRPELASPTRPWVPAYDWAEVAELEDPEWVAEERSLPEVGVTAPVVDGRPQFVLSGSYEWSSGPRTADGSSRRVWSQVSTLLVKTEDVAALIAELEGMDLAGDSILRSPMLTQGYVGEYPFGHHHGADWHVIDHEASQRFSVPTSPATSSLLGEYEYAPDDLSKVSLDAPAREFFGMTPGSLTWDGRSGWIDTSGLVVAHTRSVHGATRSELLMDKLWMDRWLEEHASSLVWIELTGKDVYGGRRDSRTSPGRLMRTLVRYRSSTGADGRARAGLCHVPAFPATGGD